MRALLASANTCYAVRSRMAGFRQIEVVQAFLLSTACCTPQLGSELPVPADDVRSIVVAIEGPTGILVEAMSGDRLRQGLRLTLDRKESEVAVLFYRDREISPGPLVPVETSHSGALPPPDASVLWTRGDLGWHDAPVPAWLKALKFEEFHPRITLVQEIRFGPSAFAAYGLVPLPGGGVLVLVETTSNGADLFEVADPPRLITSNSVAYTGAARLGDVIWLARIDGRFAAFDPEKRTISPAGELVLPGGGYVDLDASPSGEALFGISGCTRLAWLKAGHPGWQALPSPELPGVGSCFEPNVGRIVALDATSALTIGWSDGQVMRIVHADGAPSEEIAGPGGELMAIAELPSGNIAAVAAFEPLNRKLWTWDRSLRRWSEDGVLLGAQGHRIARLLPLGEDRLLYGSTTGVVGFVAGGQEATLELGLYENLAVQFLVPWTQGRFIGASVRVPRLWILQLSD